MITYILIASLITWGIAALFDEGMLLGKLGDLLINDKHAHYHKDWLRRHWHKPVFSCPTCMASVWGTIFSSYLFATGRFTTIEEWLVLCFAVCGLNFIIVKFLS
jgi:hypothetical protein